MKIKTVALSAFGALALTATATPALSQATTDPAATTTTTVDHDDDDGDDGKWGWLGLLGLAGLLGLKRRDHDHDHRNTTNNR